MPQTKVGTFDVTYIHRRQDTDCYLQRCDGSKPICDKCIARGDQEDCEYTTDVQGLTRTQMLEETVSVLEARIRQIEHPIGIVSLRDPHTITSAVGGSS